MKKALLLGLLFCCQFLSAKAVDQGLINNHWEELNSTLEGYKAGEIQLADVKSALRVLKKDGVAVADIADGDLKKFSVAACGGRYKLVLSSGNGNNMTMTGTGAQIAQLISKCSSDMRIISIEPLDTVAPKVVQ